MVNKSRENQNETITIVSFASRNPERQQELLHGVGTILPQDRFDLRFPSDDSAAVAALREAEVLFTWRFTEEMFRAANRLTWIHLSGAGADQVLFPALRTSGIVVTNSRGMHGPYIAEWTLAALFYIAQHVAEAELWRSDRQWAPHKYAITTRRFLLRGKRALIVGYGSVGVAVARALQAVGVHCGAVVTKRRPAGIPLYLARDLPATIGNYDIVLNILPLTSATRGLFSEDIFPRMKPGSIFINAGRGKTVDESAMVTALRSGHLYAAAIDVFHEEPLPEGSPLFDVPNLFLTPHIAGNFPDYSRIANDIFLDNLRRYVTGQPLCNPIDMTRGY